MSFRFIYLFIYLFSRPTFNQSRSSRCPSAYQSTQRLRSWLGSAAVLLREHLQEQHREGSILSEGNQFQFNRGCDMTNCFATDSEGARGRVGTTGGPAGAAAAREGGVGGGGAQGNNTEVGTPEPAVSTVDEEVSLAEGVVIRDRSNKENEPSSSNGSIETSRGSNKGTGQQTCMPTAEEEGLPLPAAMTLRFLAAMDEGYVGSMREENARLKRTRNKERAG